LLIHEHDDEDDDDHCCEVLLNADTLKNGGKQWQPTPKNLPRMQCARAIPVA